MRSPFKRLVKRSVRAGSNMVSQVVVSVAAAVCVGLITNAYLERTPSPTEPASTSVAPAPEQAAATFGMSEEEAAGAQNSAPARPLRAATQAAVRNVIEAPLSISENTPADVSVTLPPLDSQIVTDMPVSDVPTEGAEIFPGVPTEGTLAESLRDAPETPQKPERRHFLGLPLPNFVPSPTQFVQSASAAGSKIVSVVEGR